MPKVIWSNTEVASRGRQPPEGSGSIWACIPAKAEIPDSRTASYAYGKTSLLLVDARLKAITVSRSSDSVPRL
jgi:hypothetical protein